MAPTDALTILLETNDNEVHKKIYEAVKKSTQERLLKQFTQNFGLDKRKELNLVIEYLIASGWGNIQIIDLQMEGKKAIVVLDSSPFATALKGKAKQPADTIIRGIIAGMFSKVFEEEIECVEAECAAMQSERCKFIIKPKTEFDFTSETVRQQLNP